MTGLTIRQIAAALGGDVISRNSCNVPVPATASMTDLSPSRSIAIG